MHIALLIALLLVGGVGVAAGQSEPTDALYPVKVNVNERLGTAFSFGAEARAERELTLADRRLFEAETLAASGTLDAEARTRIEENFRLHAERTQEIIRELEAKGETEAAATVSADFRNTLSVRADALESILAATTNTSATTSTEASGAGASGSATTSVEADIQLGP